MVTENIQKCAENVFKIGALKPYQLLVIYRIVEQFDTEDEENQIVILPTGSGKSLCFLIPAVLCKKKTIIIYPLLALMNDQSAKLSKYGVKCVILRGGQTKAERDSIFKQLEGDTNIIITNPETLNQPNIISKLKKFSFEIFAVDEAHVISSWAKDFRPAYYKLKDTIAQLKPHQIISFTATASEKTIDDICEVLYKDKPIIVRADTDRDNIFYSAYPVLNKTQGMLKLLKNCQRPCIVFCGTRYTTYRITMETKSVYPNYPVRYYHAGLTKEERVNIESWFGQTEGAVLFATCAYGLGVDLPGIRTIIHYDLPDDALEYLQESGRAGRDRRQAEAWVLVPFNQKNDEGLISIFASDQCRRQALLALLGDQKEECSGCDVCTKSVIKYPYGFLEIRSLIKRYPFRYTAKSAAGLLSAAPYYYRFRMNPFYGLLDMDAGYLKESIKACGLKSVTFLNRGDLLYIDNAPNRLIASLLRFINKIKNKR